MSDDPRLTALRPLADGDPRRLGEFELMGRLAMGRVGTLFAGRAASGRLGAVQLIHPWIAAFEEYRNRLRDEVRLFAELRAHCAAPFLAADCDAPRPWLATALVPGPTLRAHTVQSRRMGEQSLNAFAAGTAEAVAAAHEVGLTHRDLTPDAVILSPEGPRITGFGVARAVDDSALGQGATPGHLAPERLDSMAARAAADVAAWAGLVVFAATGRGPSGGNGAAQGSDRTRAGWFTRPEISGPLAELIQRVLAAEPGMRPHARRCYAETLDIAAPDPGGLRPHQRLEGVLRSGWRDFDAPGPHGGFRPSAPPAQADPARAAGPRPDTAATEVTAALDVLYRLGGQGPVSGRQERATRSGGAATPGLPGQDGAHDRSAAMAHSGPGGPGGPAPGGTTKAAVVAGALLGLAALGAVSLDLAGVVSDDTSATAADPPGGEDHGEGSAAPPGGSSAVPPYEPQEVEFRGMSLRLPDQWGAYRQESLTGVAASTESERGEEWLVLVPDPEPGCDENAPWRWDEPGSAAAGMVEALCPHIAVLGPAAIEPGEGEAPAFDPSTGRFLPGTGVEACPEGVDLARAPNGDSAPETVPVGEADAVHHDTAVPCADHASFVAGEAVPEAAYHQHTWYLQQAGILIVDRWGHQDFAEYLDYTEWR